MAITFPASPVNGQTHTENGQIFVFDSTRGYWLLKKQDQIVASTSRSTFVATAGQTVHNVSYDPSASVIVSVNGVMLNPQDVTATNGTSITFDTALTLSDEVDIVFHQPTASNLIRQDIADPMATESYVQTYVTNNSSAGATTTYDNMTALVAETGMSDGDMAFVLATNNLYIYKTNGWFKIATVENLQPGSISGVDASYELATDGTPTVITATATDPEGFPLTWSYAVTTGSLGNTATVSQTDNVFTITPSTDLANSGVFGITFSATDGMNSAVNVTSAFSLSEALLTLIPTGGGATIEWDGTTNLALSSSEEYTVTAGRNASISVKMWGAGGARGMDYNASFPNSTDQGPGGGGGNTNGTIAFTSGSTYIFQVGEGGARSGTPISGATWKAGGLPVISGSYGGTEGGGYSGIFSSSVSQANALLIAGGGGGGSDESYSLHGGAGGGASGQDGYENNQGGRGGTQSAGGNPSLYNNATGGSALTGGVAGYGSNHSTLGGGGGGYYGGGGGNVGGGGGGSGYFKPSSPVSNGSTAVGSSSTPANSSDPLRSGAGDGGSSTQGSTGADGIIVLMAE
jgi:hypothetical protein